MWDLVWCQLFSILISTSDVELSVSLFYYSALVIHDRLDSAYNKVVEWYSLRVLWLALRCKSCLFSLFRHWLSKGLRSFRGTSYGVGMSRSSSITWWHRDKLRKEAWVGKVWHFQLVLLGRWFWWFAREKDSVWERFFPLFFFNCGWGDCIVNRFSYHLQGVFLGGYHEPC